MIGVLARTFGAGTLVLGTRLLFFIEAEDAGEILAAILGIQADVGYR